MRDSLRIVLAATKAQRKSVPGFDEIHRPDMGSPNWVENVDHAKTDLGTKRVAVPWSAMRTAAREHPLATPITDVLRQLAFKQGQLAQLENRDMAQQRCQLVGGKPFWTGDHTTAARDNMGATRYRSQGDTAPMTISGTATSLATEMQDGTETFEIDRGQPVTKPSRK